MINVDVYMYCEKALFSVYNYWFDFELAIHIWVYENRHRRGEYNEIVRHPRDEYLIQPI